MSIILEKISSRYSVLSLKYYALVQVPLTLLSMIVVPLCNNYTLFNTRADVVFSAVWVFIRILSSILFYAIYKRISQERYGAFCYVLLFLGLLDGPVGTLLSTHSILYLLHKRKKT